MKLVYSDGVLPGGGVFEAKLCKQLKESVIQMQSNGMDDVTAAVISKFAEALLIIPNTLAENGCFEGAAMHLIDAAACKMNVIALATEAAINLSKPTAPISSKPTTATATTISSKPTDATPEKKTPKTNALGMRQLLSPGNKRKQPGSMLEMPNPVEDNLSSKTTKLYDENGDGNNKNPMATNQTNRRIPKTCPICNKTYSDKSTLNRHVKDKHNKENE